MDALFSCRNCIHNCGQSLLIGRGAGFCVKHDSVLCQSERTTCKYLHRKDLPRFIVDEGLREHAGEFARFSGIADLVEHAPVDRRHYSERCAWEKRQFDPINQSLAQYHKTKPAWVLLQAMSGGIDGRRAVTHASLIRRYMDNCGTWKSSYRFVLAMIQDLAVTPSFRDTDLNSPDVVDLEVREDAVWDVFFTRLSGIQEYGFHAGIETLMWATDQLNGSLTDLDWGGLLPELAGRAAEWTDLIIFHATREDAFFPSHPQGEEYGEAEAS
jgi:hypothetical protein